jgi:LuxR family maltose regulon positive regulatory protein
MPIQPVGAGWADPAWQPDPLIRTKLFIPHVRPNRVPRPALLARLDAGLSRPLTLVAAPAGFGKTTLVSDWAAAAGRRVAWVSLDARDNDPLRFSAYLLAALGTLEPGLGNSLAPLRVLAERTQPPALEAVVTALINAAAELKEDISLVLDDYHVIRAAPIHAALSFWIDHLPAGLHLVITSRGDPPGLPLAQLRARDQLVELHAAQLRFSSAEVRAFLNDTMQLQLEPEAVAALDARSEGWVASLQLAALALRAARPGQPPPAPAALDGTFGRYLVDYLAEQVLQQQPPEVQRFLLETAVLDRLCAPLCDWLLETDPAAPGAAQALLDHLERAHLFLSALDDQRTWFRYHPLFAEFLQARLAQADAARLAALHRRAALWCQHLDLMEDAVRHALAAQDYDLAARLIEQVAESLWARSQILTMWRWLHAMPARLVRAQPRLCVPIAWACAISGQLDEVEPYLLAAEAALAGLAEAPCADQASLLWQIPVLRAFVARFRGQPEAALHHSRAALVRLAPEARRERAVALVHLGHAYLLQGQVAAAGETLVEAIQLSQATRHLAAGLSAVNYLALLRLMQGRLRQAGALYREALRWVEAEGEDTYSGIACIGLGAVRREQNALDEAETLIAAGLQRAEAGGDFTFVRDGYVARARLEQARGNWDAALDAMDRAEQVVRRSHTNRDIVLLAAWRARLWLAQGDLAAAAEWAAGSGLSANDPASFVGEYLHLTLARVLLAQGCGQQRRSPEGCTQPRRLLQRLLSAAEAAGRWGRVIEILAVQALELHLRGEPDLAQAALGRALRLAEPEGYVRVFADEGPPMAALLAQVRGAQQPYARRLLAAIPGAAPAAADAERVPAASGAPARPAPAALGAALTGPDPALLALDPLSSRERDVLRLIAAGLSNHDIAAALVVAPSTIHWHLKNIYSKLNVRSRTQAALLARELGLAA